MKRILLLIGVVVVLFAPQAHATLFEMDAATAIDLRKVGDLNADKATLDWVGFNDGTGPGVVQLGTKVFGSINFYLETMINQVGLVGQLRDTDASSPFPSIDLGISGNTNGVRDTLKALPGTFTGFRLHVANDDDDTYDYGLFADVGGGLLTSAFTTLTADTSTFLTLPFASTDFSSLIELGLTIRATKSAEDTYHTSVVPVPGAVLLGILGLATAGLRLRRRLA